MSTPSSATIGFVGTGVMGLSMAGHLIDASREHAGVDPLARTTNASGA